MTPSMRRTVALAVLLLLASYVPLPAQSPRAPDTELAAGIALVRDGDFEAAVLKLDTVVRRLLADAARSKEAAQAYVYLGVAFLELNQELVARGKFQQALALDPQVRLDAREFSPQQIRVFESARAEARPQVASSPSPSAPRPRSTPAPKPSPAASPVATAQNALPEEKKKSPLLWILGGAAVVGAGAAAAGGGGGGGGAPTTTTPQVGNTTSTVPTLPPETTTTTTQPAATPPPPTTTTTTSTTTTTMPAGCSTATVGAPNQPAYGSRGEGFCPVTADNSCNWSAAAIGNPNWVTLTTSSGTGNGQIRFNLALYAIGPPRQATLFLVEKPSASCTITQTATAPTVTASETALTFTSDLDLEDGQGQIVVDGAIATFQSRGSQPGAIDAPPGAHRVEATVVSAAGRPGTWRFRLAGAVAPASLRVVAGVVLSSSAEELLFRVSGKPGERILFVFRVR
jgi:hypothetical protein